MDAHLRSARAVRRLRPATLASAPSTTRFAQDLSLGETVMALSTENKLYISLGVLAVLGGALFLQNKKDKAEAQSYTLSGQAAQLPKIELSEDDLKKVDKITLSKPAGDAGAPVDIELTKSGEDWKLTKPVEASANQPNVKSLLDNLKTLKVTELIDASKASYGKFGLSDDK